jgi:hypothetical protein
MRTLSSVLLGCAAVIASASSACAALVISSAPTSNVTCSAGVCSATSANAVLNAGDLATTLALGNVNVESGSDAIDIDVTAPLAWATRRTLTLTANGSIAINATVAAEGTGARVVLVTGSGGDLTFTGGSLDFWSTHSHLTINGTAYVLVADLSTLAADVAAHPTRAYALAKSYDAGPDGTYAHSPVTATLTGKFEGLGHTIDNLSIASSDVHVGLFATANGASLRDVAVTNASLVVATDNEPYVGTLLGYGTSTAINHVSASGSVSGYFTGGIAGRMDSGSLNDLSAGVAVTSLDYGGGIVGIMDGPITRCHASGTVTSSGAGGLVGYFAGNVTDSSATGNITEYALGGGLIAYYGPGTIQSSYATGSVTNGAGVNNTIAGGLIGNMIAAMTMTNVYALGNVAAPGTGTSGGLLGYDGGSVTISHSYAAGTVSGGHANQTGGFAGVFYGTLTGNFWDVTTGGAVPKHGIGKCHGTGCTTTVGLTTTELQSGLPAGFDPSVWGSNPTVNGGFPYLLANPPQ